jgi:hypothetical protein
MLPKPNLTKAAFAIAVAMAYSCSEQAIPVETAQSTAVPSSASVDNARKGNSENASTFNVSVGAPIESTTGERWIGNYTKNADGSPKTYTIKAAALNKILCNKKCVGISLAYAQDKQKILHVLPIGVDGEGRIIFANSVYTQNGDISWKAAKNWIANYTGPVQSHFFGQNTFQRLWENGNADVVITFALDDNNSPQLLLAVATPASASGKVSAQSKFEDASAACPPACPK